MKRDELIQLLGCANEPKEGDLSIGVGAPDESRRAEAQRELKRLRLNDILSCPIVEDSQTECLRALLMDDPASAEALRRIQAKTVGEVQGAILSADSPDLIRQMGVGMTSEMIAAVAKLMTNEQLVRVCSRVFSPVGGPGSVGAPECLGSRIQPNSPTDDPTEVLYSICEGISYGCGDVIIGINPANDTVDAVIELENLLARIVGRLQLPTRWSVLSDMKKQREALSMGAMVDVGFQSLAGTSRALQGMLACDVAELLDLCRSFNGLYFETGQGAEFTNGADEGIDMVTLESRTYGLARLLARKTGKWTIVNDVAGFIGPEVFRTKEQLMRACLEDLFMGKLHGLAMGLDVCSTFHMGIPPDDLDAVTEQVAHAAPAYLMAVAGKADPMLGYLTTDFRSHPRLRRRLGKSVGARARTRLRELGVMRPDGSLTDQAADLTPIAIACGESAADVPKTVRRLQERGMDIGYGHVKDFRPPSHVRTRLQEVFKHARKALYSQVDVATTRVSGEGSLNVSSVARDREEYIGRPQTGERIDPAGVRAIQALYAGPTPQIQIVISDGLNADAVNENLRGLLPALKARLRDLGFTHGKDIYVRNGRVRAGYHIGDILNPEIVAHLIGERPGTGTNSLSAYLTFGRSRQGTSRWSAIRHSDTTALCSINKQVGVAPEEAALRIAALIDAMLRHRCSGVALIPHLGKEASLLTSP